MRVVLKVLFQDGPLGIHFLKRGILIQKGVYIVANLGTGIWNKLPFRNPVGLYGKMWGKEVHLPYTLDRNVDQLPGLSQASSREEGT